jgi:hypothetical protein
MKLIVTLALVGLSVGCASRAAPVATVATDGTNPACRDTQRAHQRRQRDLALRQQRMKQYHARGLSPPENETALARELEASRMPCVPAQPADEPVQPASGPVEPLQSAAEPVQPVESVQPLPPADDQSTD